MNGIDWGVIALVFAPVCTLIGIWIQARRSGKNNTDQVSVQARQANTHEVEVLLEGHKAYVELIKAELTSKLEELKETRAEMRKQESDMDELKLRVQQLEEDMVVLESDKVKLLDYIGVIEQWAPADKIKRPVLGRRV